MMDLHIVSTLGFTDEDVDRIMKTDGQPRGSGSYRSLMMLRMKFQKNISCTIKE